MEIPTNQTIEFQSRKDSYEVVEELITTISWIILLTTFVVNFNFDSVYFWSVVGFLYFIIIAYSLQEILSWRAEWHIITSYNNSSGGVYYKKTGWINEKVINIPITPTLTPTVDEYPQNIFYWLFKTLTGKRMQKVTLKTESHVFLSNTRMSPVFYNSLNKIRGSKPSSVEMPELYKNIEAILKAKQGGIIKDDFAEYVGTGVISKLIE